MRSTVLSWYPGGHVLSKTFMGVGHNGPYSQKQNNFSPPYSRNKSHKQDCLFFLLAFNS